MNWQQILTGDCRAILPTLEPGSVQCCVTSPPYWGLRDYGTAQWEGGDGDCDHIDSNGTKPNSALAELADKWAPRKNPRNPVDQDTPRQTTFRDICDRCGAHRIDSQLGLESTPQEYVEKLVAVFREVWRVLRDDGTLWLNMGDSYAGGNNTRSGNNPSERSTLNNGRGPKPGDKYNSSSSGRSINRTTGLKPKDLCGIPWRMVFALQADGWYLRSDIIWHKPNPMPESVTDRPTKVHEYIFLLAKNGCNPLVWKARDTGQWSYRPDLNELLPDGETPRWKSFDYFYDAEAIRELAECAEGPGNLFQQRIPNQRNGENANLINGLHKVGPREFRNKRTVWTIATQPYAEAHFATFPEEIPKLCILAGSRVGDTVLDPFAGSGTVGKVALELGRKAILIELNPDYIEMVHDRTFVTPGFL